MGARASIQKRLDKLQTELNSLHDHARETFGEIEKHEFAIQELVSLLKTLPEDDDAENGQVQIALRKGSDAAKSRDALRKVRVALHVDDLLREIGKPVEKKARVSLAGQLSFYVRKNQIFTRPEPNTFGLREWEVNGNKKTKRDADCHSGDRALSLEEVEADNA